jgi:hypothetical protein
MPRYEIYGTAIEGGGSECYRELRSGEIKDALKLANQTLNKSEALFYALATLRSNDYDLFSIDRQHFWEIECSKSIEKLLPNLLFQGYPGIKGPFTTSNRTDLLISMMKKSIDEEDHDQSYFLLVNGNQWVFDFEAHGVGGRFMPVVDHDLASKDYLVRLEAPSGDYTILSKIQLPWFTCVSKIGGSSVKTSFSRESFVTVWASAFMDDRTLDDQVSWGLTTFADRYGLGSDSEKGLGDLAKLLNFAISNRLSNFTYKIERPFLKQQLGANWESLNLASDPHKTWKVSFGDLTGDEFQIFTKFVEDYEYLDDEES